MTMTMKYLKLLLAALVVLVFIEASGADSGFVARILLSFGNYGDAVFAGLLAWLIAPFVFEET
jgi:hypothetical protein